MLNPRKARTAWALTRREMLLALGATATLPVLPGCHKKATPPPPNLSTYDTFRALRTLIRTSPDHLSARAAEVIASKNFTSAVQFVRDQIAVLPPSYATDGATDKVRWGPDATLRAGAGTQRERAELLKAMLTAMGATAQIVSALTPSTLDAAALYKTRPPAFSIDTSQLPSLGSAAAAQAALINDPFPDTDPSSLYASVLSMIPSSQAVTEYPFNGLDTRVPLVAYTVNGTTKWAIALGTIDEVTTAPAGLSGELGPVQYPTVSVRLLASMGDLPGAPTPPGLVELVAGTWTADQLAGGRLLITTGSADPALSVGTPADQVTIRTPLMQVQRPTPLAGSGDPALWSPSVGSPAPAPFGGGPITLSGGQIPARAQGTDPVVGPYGTLSTLGATAHAAALASVASVQAFVQGGSFPQVQLTVAALDGSGNPVSGLVNSDFSVTDEGVAQTATLLSNAPVQAMKAMVTFDCDAINVVFPTPASLAAFDLLVANACVASATTQPFLLGVTAIGNSPAGGYVAPDGPTIQNVFGTCTGTTDDVWTTVGSIVPADGVSAIVIVSDFFPYEDPATIPALQARAIASGVAIACVPMGNVNQPTVDALVQNCGAVVLDYTAATFQQDLTNFLSTAAARSNKSGYRFSYRIPGAQQSNQGTRTVAVSLATRSSVATTAQYVVPPVAGRGNAGIAGLYLELTPQGGAVVTRRLAGPQLNRFLTPLTAVASDFDDTRAVLNGIITVAFEPGSPTSAQNGEDVISSVLSLEPLSGAVGKTMGDALKAAAGIRPCAMPLSLLVDPEVEPAANPVVAPERMRVVIGTETAGTGGPVFTLDIVPELNRAAAGTLDPAASFQSVLRSGVALSLRESQVMTSSAAGLLSKVALQYLPPSGDPSTLKNFTTLDVARWQHLFDQYGGSHLLLPTDPAVGAAWVVDRTTGSTIAVFIDGSGGSTGGCNNAVNNGDVQIVIALLQSAIAYYASQCLVGSGFSCDGAIVYSVGASTVALFVGVVFDQNIAVDIGLLGLGMIIGIAPGGIPVAASILMVLVAMLQYATSVSAACGP